MTTPDLPGNLPIHAFPSAKEFEDFLEREHSTLPGFYLKLAKKASGIPSITAADAVEVALCFGWIDGWGKGIDDKHWVVRYTPRRPKSIWSQKNVNTVARLTEDGRIRPAGLAAVEAAKADGRWDRAYAGPSSITVPDDFAALLAAEPAANSFFAALNRSTRYNVLWRIQTCSPNTRAKRMQAMVQMLSEGKTPNDLVKPKAAPKTKKSKAAPIKETKRKAVRSSSRLKKAQK